jgi:hypothetical protein
MVDDERNKGGNMKTRILSILLGFIISLTPGLFSADWTTKPERTEYKETSSYREVMAFLYKAQTLCDKIELVRLATSTENRPVPLAVISSDGVKSPQELALSGKPAVLIMANIHAGEVEGKEAVLMLIRDVAANKDAELLKNQVLLVVPIFNADGNDKWGKNRGDNGPELAGVRHNGQFLDLNRDYLKMESPEIKGLITVLNQWDPVLVVDLHTTDGSYHREPVTYSTLTNPNGDANLSAYMWNRLFPAVARHLKDTYGYDSLPYGNFVDRTQPEKGWLNHAFLARYGSNYVGLRNRFTILDENYAHADFKTRVLGCYGFVKSLLHYTHQHIGEMQQMVKTADSDTKNNYYRENFVLEFDNQKLFDVTIKSYEFEIEKIKPEDAGKYPPWIKDYIAKKTDVLRDYTVPYFCKAVSTRSVTLPRAYLIFPYHNAIIENLKRHGIVVEKIIKPCQAPLEMFKIDEIKTEQGLYQGHVFVRLKGHYAMETLTVPENSYLVPMNQPLARLIPVLLEPESEDSLVTWGFFNRELISQWTEEPLVYPVFRLHATDIPLERCQE